MLRDFLLVKKDTYGQEIGGFGTVRIFITWKKIATIFVPVTTEEYDYFLHEICKILVKSFFLFRIFKSWSTYLKSIATNPKLCNIPFRYYWSVFMVYVSSFPLIWTVFPSSCAWIIRYPLLWVAMHFSPRLALFIESGKQVLNKKLRVKLNNVNMTGCYIC